MNVARWFVFVALFGVAPSPTPLPVSVDNVTSVEVTIVVGALGPGSSFERTFQKNQLDRSTLEGLLDAVALPPTDRFDFSGTGITPDTLARSAEPLAASYLGRHRANLDAWGAFRDAFMDLDNLRATCTRGMQTDFTTTDYYPSLVVTVRAGAREIRVSSRSQRVYMLPLDVTDEQSSYTTWEPALSIAIAQLLPAKAPLRDVLLGTSVLQNWARAISIRRDVTLAIAGSDTIGDTARADFFTNPCLTPVVPYPTYR